MPMGKQKTDQRNSFWQIVRGMCILAVVMLHCPDGSSYTIGSLNNTVWTGIHLLVDFPVAIFIFMAGFFTNLGKCKSHSRTYVLSRGGRLLIPFILWSLFYSLYSLIGEFLKGETISWVGYAYRFVIGKAGTPFYYIVVLIQLTLITPWLVRAIEKRGICQKLLWLVTPAYLIYLYIYNLSIGGQPPLYETLFPAWFIFYYLGLNVRYDRNRWDTIADRFGKIYVPLIMLVFEVMETWILIKSGASYGFAVSQIRISSFIYATSLVMVLLRYSNSYGVKGITNKLVRFLEHTGDYSFGIFFIHCFILKFVTRALQAIGVGSVWGVYFLLTWIVVSLISFYVVLLVNRIFRNRTGGERILRWIGFR